MGKNKNNNNNNINKIIIIKLICNIIIIKFIFFI